MAVMEMSDKELITTTIDRYTDLQQIKKANGGHENEVLDYLIKVTAAKLSSLAGKRRRHNALTSSPITHETKSVKPMELPICLTLFVS